MFTLFDTRSAVARADRMALDRAAVVGTLREFAAAGSLGRFAAVRENAFPKPFPLVGGLVLHPRWRSAPVQRLRFRGTQPAALRGRGGRSARRFAEPRPDWPGTAGLRNRRRAHPSGARHLLHRR